jgi:hypothetical protein
MQWRSAYLWWREWDIKKQTAVKTRKMYDGENRNCVAGKGEGVKMVAD